MILNVEDVFEDIPDSDDVLMKIPDEIITQMGWNVGDKLFTFVENDSIIIRRVDNEVEDE